MFYPRSTISDYLKPKRTPLQRLMGAMAYAQAVSEALRNLRPYLAYLKPVRAYRLPSIRAGAVVGALLWAIILFGGHWALQQHNVTSPKGLAAARATNAIATSKQATMQLASTLPAGPTGMLLPPGTMAPIYTYRNSYARGQCTWYVAGRRPIPDHWGNANAWYSHAARAGWKVGTVPAIAAIATTSAGWYGHVALVEAIEGNQVLISEMNYIGPYKLSHRWVPASSFRYIY